MIVIGSKYKICRQVGYNIWHKDKKNIKFNRKPGQQSSQLKKQSLYGRQLQEKQKIRFYYGKLTDKQFFNTYKRSLGYKGDMISNFMVLLERRLDTVVYRMNFSSSIFGARQLISHGHILVNGIRVTVPSYMVRDGDIVQVRKKSISFVLSGMKRDLTEDNWVVNTPAYIEMNYNIMAGMFLYSPVVREIPFPVPMNPELVFQYYK